MANESISTNGPWWLEILKTAGPTAAIAIFLVYTLAMQVVPVLSEMKLFMQAHTNQMQLMIETEKEQQKQIMAQWDQLVQLQNDERAGRETQLQIDQQTCINTAKSSYQTTKCLEIRNNAERVGIR